MTKTIKTKDKTLEVALFDEGKVEIESGLFGLYKNVGIGIKRVDPSKDISSPKGALYVIETYHPESRTLYQSGSVWVMSDGTILETAKRQRGF